MARDRASRPEAKPQRLFVAITIPERAAEAVEEAMQPWQEAFPRARWVPRANWHVTVQFLGWTYPRLVPWVRGRLAEVAARTPLLETRVRGVGAFPSVRRARVLWAGLDDDGSLTGLAGAVSASLAREFQPESRPFSAHLTVARSDPPISLPASYSETTLESEPFAVEVVTLMRSHLRRPAPVYEPVGEFTLSGT